MEFGSVRISAHEQTHALQQYALSTAGCERHFPFCSGPVACACLPELQRLCNQMIRDDILAV